MNDLTILLAAFGIPLAILLTWYLVRDFRERYHWQKMWSDIEKITDMDEGRERWHQFLREEDCEDKIALPKVEEMFQGIWKDTRDERKR